MPHSDNIKSINDKNPSSCNYEFTFNNLPILLAAGRIADDPHWTFPLHKHENFCEIIYISRGEGEFIINGELYRAKKGDILIYNKGVPHEEKATSSVPIETYFTGVANVSISGIEEGYIIPRDIPPVIHAGEYSYKIESYISDLFEECRAKIIGYETICQNLLSLLILLIIRIVSSQQSTIFNKENSKSLAFRVKEYIDNNYTKNISLNEIANTVYISQYYLSHVFKTETGFSPINYMITKRINHAKEFLSKTDKSVAEISSIVGYDNPNYFNIIFKKITGLTPGKYREEVSKGAASK